MGKTTYYKRLKGSQNFRQRLLLATLSSTSILIEDIRADHTLPGLRPHEFSLLDLLAKVSFNYLIDVNDTGTKVTYMPGTVVGKSNLEHDCGVSRSIGYFLEPLIVLGLIAKNSLCIRLKGITNDSKDPSVDTFLSTTLPLLKRFGVPSEGLDLKIVRRGSPPHGGGEVVLTIHSVKQLNAVTWTDFGMVKRIRGCTFSTRASFQFEMAMIHAARNIFSKFIPDVYIFTDHKAGPQAGNSSGYGISLVAETNAGCFISADTTVSNPRAEETGEIEDEKKYPNSEDVGEEVASVLLGEIEQGGVVDSRHQVCVLIIVLVF
uniref:RNA 3'-terminal phosphate cyclase domain-containing protein n=1 Tax=Fagus sylvatica TaxID=28930 RepID=A0A2N9EJS6_FAGSY